MKKPRLLAGGNPQIAKGEGDTPVQAYIAAMPGWKRDLGRRLDKLIVRTVPGVHKAVLHEVHQAGILPRHLAAACAARRVQQASRLPGERI